MLELTAGDVFGEEAFLDGWGGLRACSAVAHGGAQAPYTRVQLLSLRRKDFEHVVQRSIFSDASFTSTSGGSSGGGVKLRNDAMAPAFLGTPHHKRSVLSCVALVSIKA